MYSLRFFSLPAFMFAFFCLSPASAADTNDAATKAAASKETIYGIAVQPDGGSGPDKTRFKIVSEKEFKKQSVERSKAAPKG